MAYCNRAVSKLVIYRILFFKESRAPPPLTRSMMPGWMNIIIGVIFPSPFCDKLKPNERSVSQSVSRSIGHSYCLTVVRPSKWRLGESEPTIADNLDDRLNPNLTLSDYQLTQVTLVRSSSPSPASRSVSTSDILRLQQREAEILAREAVAVAAKRNFDRNRNRSLIQQGRHKSVRSDMEDMYYLR